MKTPESVRVSTLVPKLQPYLGRESRMQSRWSADSDFVFSAARGKPKDYANVRRALATASQHAGLERVRAHDLRHSYTSNLIPHTDLMTVARAVGHKNIAVTAKVYAHALGTPEQQAERAALAAAAAGLAYYVISLWKPLRWRVRVASSETERPALRAFLVWSVPGSNRRPPACKAGALPAELTPLGVPV